MTCKIIFVRGNIETLIHHFVLNFVQYSSTFEMKLPLILTPLLVCQDIPKLQPPLYHVNRFTLQPSLEVSSVVFQALQ